MKIRTMAIKCSICGEIFFPGNKPNGEPNGVGFELEDGSVLNICIDCLHTIEKRRSDIDTIIKPSAE